VSGGVEKEMTFWEHLEELRRVIIDCFIALLAALAIAWFVAGRVQDGIIHLLVPDGVEVVALTPYELFTSQLRVALGVATLISLPFLAWRIWRFILPGLLEKEKRVLIPLAAASTVLFYVGSAFAFLALSPVILRLLLSFGGAEVKPTMSITSILDFVLWLCLAIGGVFEMPLVAMALAHLGLVSSSWMLRQWRYAVLIIFVVAAVATPGDGPTQLIIGFPVTALYFISIGLARLVERRQRQGGAAGEDTDAGGEDDGGDDGDGGGGGQPASGSDPVPAAPAGEAPQIGETLTGTAPPPPGPPDTPPSDTVPRG